MPVPDVARLTVTSSCVVPDRVAVSVRVDNPAFSAIDDALLVNVTVGGFSLSIKVKLTY